MEIPKTTNNQSKRRHNIVGGITTTNLHSNRKRVTQRLRGDT